MPANNIVLVYATKQAKRSFGSKRCRPKHIEPKWPKKLAQTQAIKLGLGTLSFGES